MLAKFIGWSRKNYRYYRTQSEKNMTACLKWFDVLKFLI